MTERRRIRRELKKQLRQAKSFRSNLPRYIDCSEVYGDNSFTKDDYAKVDAEIARIKSKLALIDNT